MNLFLPFHLCKAIANQKFTLKAISCACGTAGLFFSAFTYSAELNIPHEFTSGTPAIAAEVNENFTATETSVNNHESRIDSLETSLSDLVTRIESLESAGPALSVDSYFATDLVFLTFNGPLTIPTGVDGNQSEPGTIGTGREWQPLPGLTEVAFTVDQDNTTVLIKAEGEASYPQWNAYAYFEAGILVNDIGPAKGAIETAIIVTDDTVSAGQGKWHILHPVVLNQGEHTFSVVVRVPHSQNEGEGSIAIDGRSSGDFPGKIKATLFKITP